MTTSQFPALEPYGLSAVHHDLLPAGSEPARVIRHDGTTLLGMTAAGPLVVRNSTRLDPQPTVGDWLAIHLPAITLTRVWRGKLGFARFCADFLTGSQVFRAEDFPESTEQLKNLDIRWIKISYRITGAGPVVQTLRRAPAQAPGEIVSCWAD